VLRELYTSGVAESLVVSPRPESVLFGSGVFASQPLRDLVARYVDRPMLTRVAAEYAKGRCLAVVTTDLDAQRTVVWDMGRIASHGSAAALGLFRDVLTSASVTVVLPPVFIDVEANVRAFREMHVDGGVTAPVFTLPGAFLLSNARPERPVRWNIYVLITTQLIRISESCLIFQAWSAHGTAPATPTPSYCRASRRAFAAFRSAVSNPSVNRS
jgi:hypothetical protein